MNNERLKLKKAIAIIQKGIDAKDIAMIQEGRDIIDEQDFDWKRAGNDLFDKWEKTIENAGMIVFEDFENNYDDSDEEENHKKKLKKKRTKARNFKRFSTPHLQDELNKLNGCDLTKVSMEEINSIKCILNSRASAKIKKKSKGARIIEMLKENHPIPDIAEECRCTNDYVLQTRWNAEQKGILDARKRRAAKAELEKKRKLEKERRAAELKDKTKNKKKIIIHRPRP